MAAKNVTKTKAPAKKTAAAEAPKGGIVLKQICKDLKVEPKAARRQLRKAGLSFHSSRERWVIPTGQVAKVKEVLSSAA